MDLIDSYHLLLHILRERNTIATELLSDLQDRTTHDYLNVLAKFALDVKYTEVIFISHEEVFVEISSRWLKSFSNFENEIFAAYARLLPLAPYLTAHLSQFLELNGGTYLASCFSSDLGKILNLSYKGIQNLLTSVYRLLNFDNRRYARFISPVHLIALLKHSERHIRYLAVRVLSQYLHASGSALQDLVEKHVGPGDIVALWELQKIDYSFFTLWERHRERQLRENLHEGRRLLKQTLSNSQRSSHQWIAPDDLTETTAIFGDILIPRIDHVTTSNSTLVPTKITVENLRKVATAIKSQRPLLVSGGSGTGKSAIIQEIAHGLGHLDSMIILHVNEQIDTKLMLGAYASSKTQGSFVWQPGILTKAVMQGSWVVIEDIDRAPLEFLGLLKTLNERKEILLPAHDEVISSHPSFRVIGTMRNSSLDGEKSTFLQLLPLPVGGECWDQVQLTAPSFEDLTEIVMDRYSCVTGVLPSMKVIFMTLTSDLSFRQGSFRSLSPMHLLRWCRRVHKLLQSSGYTQSSDPISQSTLMNIFLEAFDILGSHLPHGPARERLLELVARAFTIPIQIAEHTVRDRTSTVKWSKSIVEIGRAKLQRNSSRPGKIHIKAQSHSRFALTNLFMQNLEKVAVCVQLSESCLLVGETGSGKTSSIQYLAEACGQRLEVFNLSQEIEAGDLFGGFKPVNPRSIILPMRDDFADLLSLLFPSRRNEKFLQSLDSAIVKGAWTRALRLWDEAVKSIDPLLHALSEDGDSPSEEPQQKRRKLHAGRIALRPRWMKFVNDVETFRAQVCKEGGGFAFQFVESRLVHALRNGHWVLLDEINMAPSDVLDCLGDLFTCAGDQIPSLLLPEAGQTERIQAHPAFRIFGAMNPATDVGKKDIPANIRSKFTEVYFDNPDEHLDNLVAVAGAYLGKLCENDVAIADDLGKLYVDVKKLSFADRLVDGSDRRPHFSLRTFTRVLTFTRDTVSVYGLRRAAFEGFSMCFSSTLDPASASLVNDLIESRLLSTVKNRSAMMYQKPRQPTDGMQYINFRQYWILRGNEDIQQQPHYIITPFIQDNLMNVVRGTSTRRFPILLQGPTSSGKTSMVEYLAKMTGNTFIRVNNHEHTDIQEYLGSYASDDDGKLGFRDGVLVTALKQGHWIVLDELNLAPTDILEALNRLLDDNRELLIPETQEIVRPHRNFMLFATQNPPGVYGGRKILSRAFRNRFLELHFNDIPEDELETILRERCQIAPSFCAKIVAVYKHLAVLRQSNRVFEQRHSFATLRDLFRWAFRRADTREELAIDGFMLLAERVRDAAEREAVKTTIEQFMKTNIQIDELYSNRRCQEVLKRSGVQAKHIAWTKSIRRAFILIVEALKRNEPVLLIGETGSGKTTICQVIAEIMGRRLNIVNAHQNLETGDLIGTQRPLRNRTLLEDSLKQAIIAALEIEDFKGDKNQMTHGALSMAYDEIKKSSRIPSDLKDAIHNLRARAQTLFEWIDGSIVTAMKQGHHFLLDEISLAEDAVLERLNSVLEPSRSLYLAEKGAIDPLVVAEEGFQFLATMNPGGDYGKRELSAALRNRFTEIWIPPISDASEFLEIVEFKLKDEFKSEATSLVDFSLWYTCEFESQFSHASIRDLLSWIGFINQKGGQGLTGAILTGAASVYLDRLGANPTSKGVTLESDVPEQRQKCIQRLQSTFRVSFVGNVGFEVMLSETGTSDIATFGSDIHVASAGYTSTAPTAHANLKKILRALNFDKPILIEGSAGVGKTASVAAIAEQRHKTLHRVNLSDQTDLVDLFGSEVPVNETEIGHFGWVDAPFLQAMREGHWLLLDEMNLATQSVLEGLNACFDHRGEVYIPELSQTFAKHPEFRVFATQNPHNQGAGRKGLPKSFVNRFSILFADSLTGDDIVEIGLTTYPQSERSVIETLVRFGDHVSVNLSQQFAQYQGSSTHFSVRDALRWLGLIDGVKAASRPTCLSAFVPMLFGQKMRTDSGELVVINAARSLPTNSHEGCLIVDRNQYSLRLGLAEHNRQVLRSKVQHLTHCRITDLSIAESTMLSIMHHWPLLLVGPSERALTDLVLSIAALTGAETDQICFYPGMDTIDLLGGYEQIDIRRVFDSFVRRLVHYVHMFILETLLTSPQVDDLIMQVSRLDWSSSKSDEVLTLLEELSASYPTSKFPDLYREHQVRHRSNRNNETVGFAWADGTLVKAVKEGRWLILENANFCDASVLDRLNSLLEPGGSLLINEHRTSEGIAERIQPHPDFRIFLTMNPSRGELSQAMRSRCVELFLQPSLQIPKASFSKLDPTIEPSLARLSLLFALELKQLDRDILPDFLLAYLGQLSAADLVSLASLQDQCLHGLGALSAGVLTELNQALHIYDNIINADTSFAKRLQKLQVDTMPSTAPHTTSISSSQTVHPHYDMSSLQETSSATNLAQRKNLGHIFNLLIALQSLDDRITGIAQTVPSKKRQKLTILEQSLLPHGGNLSQANGILSLGPNILSTIAALRSFVNSLCLLIDLDTHDFDFCLNLVLQLQHIVRISSSALFTRGHLSAQLRLASDEIAIVNHDHFHGDITPSYRSVIERWEAMTSLDRLCSGMAMETLWACFQPPLARTKEQYQHARNAKTNVEKFNGIKWNLKIPIQEIMGQHKSLLHHVNETMSSAWRTSDFDRINSAMEKLCDDNMTSSNGQKSYFFQEFDMLRQIECSCSGGASEIYQELSFLSEHTSDDLLIQFQDVNSPWSQLASFASSLIGSFQSSELAIFRSQFPLSTIRRLDQAAEIPLRSLSRFEADNRLLIHYTLQMLSKVTLDSSEEISLRLTTIMSATSMKLRHDFRNAETLDSFNAIQYLPERLNVQGVASVGNAGSSTLHVERVIERLMKNTENTPDPSHRAVRSNRRELAEHSISFFMALILLYVPDKQFDPADRKTLLIDNHYERISHLGRRLDALQRFENMVTKQESSYPIQLVEEELRNVKAAPEPVCIYRPSQSHCESLRPEFENILRLLVCSPFGTDHSIASDSHEASSEQIKSYTQEVEALAFRVHENTVAVDDVAQPLWMMLESLKGALKMLRLAEPASQETAIINHMASLTPLMCSEPPPPTTITMTPQRSPSQSTVTDDLFNIGAIALVKNIEGYLPDSLLDVLFAAFQKLYNHWKRKLVHDRERAASKSALYRYQGKDNENDQSLEVEDLFPTYENGNISIMPTSQVEHDPSDLARRMAMLHGLFFTEVKLQPQRMLGLLRDASCRIASLWSDPEDVKIFPISPENMLPSLLMHMTDNYERLSTPAMASKTFNFYKDENMIEVKRLVEVLLQTQSKFMELQLDWPDHASINGVVDACNEILDMKHTDPLAKLLTKVERLHFIVNEWQTVASVKYSASACSKSLGDLIISWRRLELTSWSQLLDTEDQQCQTDADSWWFIAYENIVVSSMSYELSREENDTLVENLLETLQKFIVTTSVGQFHHRLHTLQLFKQHLKLIARRYESLHSLANALGSLVQYYSSYISLTKQHIQEGRHKLEKQLQEVLLLASWKDTNTVALRESAKRSHHKLIKLVHKYRNLLSEPVECILGRTPRIFDPNVPHISCLAMSIDVVAPHRMAHALCERQTFWSEMPSRYRDALSTSKKLTTSVRVPHEIILLLKRLESYSTQVHEDISEFQVPGIIDKQGKGKDVLKYQTNRKRKLFADTLREIRSMGFNSSISQDILDLQSSPAKIWTTLSTEEYDSEISGGETREHLDALIEAMSQVRNRMQGHHHDLHTNDSSRAHGMLENMFASLIGQRNFLIANTKALTKFQGQIRVTQNLWNMEDEYSKRSAGDRERENAIDRCLAWLPPTIDSVRLLLERFSRHANSDMTIVFTSLEDQKAKIIATARRIEDLPIMPQNVNSSRCSKTYAQAENILTEIGQWSRQTTHQWPDLKFLWKRIEMWTNIYALSEQERDCAQSEEPNMSLDDFGGQLSSFLDSMLIQVQQVFENFSSMSARANDTRWLLQSMKVLGQAIKGIRLAAIHKRMTILLGGMHDLGTDQNLGIAAALLHSELPIMQEYYNAGADLMTHYRRAHDTFLRLTLFLANTFIKIQKDGLCIPDKASNPQDVPKEQLEGGTGLGEGDGNEDISKDVEEDEDLSELAENPSNRDDAERPEANADAVNMDADDLNGELGELSEQEDAESSSEREVGTDIEDEMHHVDDLGPSKVDDKFWDGDDEQPPDQSDQQNTDTNSGERKDHKPQSSGQLETVNDDNAAMESEHEEEEDTDDPMIQPLESIAQDEAEGAAPNKDEEMLDLPPDMHLDNMSSSKSVSTLDDEDLADLSDAEALSDMDTDVAVGGSEPDVISTPKDESSAEDGVDSHESGDVDKDQETATGTDKFGDEMGNTIPMTTDKTGLPALKQDEGLDLHDTADDGSREMEQEIGDKPEHQEDASRHAQSSTGGSQSRDAEGAKTRGNPQKDLSDSDKTRQSLQHLGNALEEWRRTQRKLQEASDRPDDRQPMDVQTQDIELEHIAPEHEQSQHQALGAASDEQVTALDKEALASEKEEAPQDTLMQNMETEDSNDAAKLGEEDEPDVAAEISASTPRITALVTRTTVRGVDESAEDEAHRASHQEDEIDTLDQDLTVTHLTSPDTSIATTTEEASRLWTQYERTTHGLACRLTEELRLIMEPTQATRMRGDFRTGKRLNMKRIIPYIASQYKKDKIWMRRSLPSKRNYQIILAVDDSKSMQESGSGHLAFEALALITKSLTMLEAGQVCVMGFGTQVTVAHDFGIPLTQESGANMIRKIEFKQPKTDVLGLLARSIDKFQEARARASSSSADVWHLELIISDGICEDHDAIRRLLRRAQRERIMIVFVIVDSIHPERSIIEMSQATFEAADDGERKIVIKRYLDDFPFPYYLIVADIKELPNVLAQALKQWFSEIQDSS